MGTFDATGAFLGGGDDKFSKEGESKFYTQTLFNILYFRLNVSFSLLCLMYAGKTLTRKANWENKTN